MSVPQRDEGCRQRTQCFGVTVTCLRDTLAATRQGATRCHCSNSIRPPERGVTNPEVTISLAHPQPTNGTPTGRSHAHWQLCSGVLTAHSSSDSKNTNEESSTCALSPFSAKTARTTSPAFVAIVLKWSCSIQCSSHARSTASTRSPSISS